MFLDQRQKSMINLIAVIDRFIAEAVDRQIADCMQPDNVVINALNDPAQPDRVVCVQDWLRRYGVLRGIPNGVPEQIAETVIDFADNREPNAVPDNPYAVIEAFTLLHASCYAVHARKYTSLVSKALWCCYPSVVPIFDEHVERALWLISRLMEMPPPESESKYERFVEVWFELYDVAAPIIAQADLRGYPYSVRVFDKILWIVGQPHYGVGA